MKILRFTDIPMVDSVTVTLDDSGRVINASMHRTLKINGTAYTKLGLQAYSIYKRLHEIDPLTSHFELVLEVDGKAKGSFIRAVDLTNEMLDGMIAVSFIPVK